MTTSDTIPFRAYQPKRPWRVAKLGGGHRTFASINSAVVFAATQANQSLTSPVWTITNTASGQMVTVDRAENTTWGPRP